MGKNTLWSLAFAMLTGLCTLLPSTVISVQELPQHHRDTQTRVSDQELEAFAKAYVEYETIRRAYEPSLKNAPDSEEGKRIEQEASAKLEEALAKQGLTPETYKQILNAVNADDELRKRALKLIDEERSRS